MDIVKRFMAMTSPAFQEELKRLYFRRQIKRGTFVTNEPEYLNLENLIGPGDWVIDIGANIGHYTNRLSALVGAAGRVIAFEPVPITFAHLSQNTLLCEHRNITLINAAVSDNALLVNMSIPDFSTGLKNYYQANISPESEVTGTPVLTISIDSLQLKNKIKLIKIDAEGHEPAVIRGAQLLLARDRPALIIETVTDEIRGLLLQLGYTEERYKGSPNIVFRVDG